MEKEITAEFKEMPAAAPAPAAAENAPKIDEAKPIDEVIRSAEAKIQAAASAPLKRKRGRPRKYENPQAPAAAAPAPAPIEPAPVVSLEPPADFRPMIKQGSGYVSSVLVSYFDSEAAALTKDETEQLAEGLNPFCQKYFPELGKLSPEATAIICCVSVFCASAMRVENERRKRNEKKQETAPAPAQAVPNRLPLPNIVA